MIGIWDRSSLDPLAATDLPVHHRCTTRYYGQRAKSSQAWHDGGWAGNQPHRISSNTEACRSAMQMISHHPSVMTGLLKQGRSVLVVSMHGQALQGKH